MNFKLLVSYSTKYSFQKEANLDHEKPSVNIGPKLCTNNWDKHTLARTVQSPDTELDLFF